MMAVGRSIRLSMRRTSLDRHRVRVNTGVHDNDNDSSTGTGILLFGLCIFHTQFLDIIILIQLALAVQISLEVVTHDHHSVG